MGILQAVSHAALHTQAFTRVMRNGNVIAWNKVILAFCISFHFMGNGQNRPKCAKIRGNLL